MLLLNLVAEEMDFRIQFQAFFPNLAILSLQLKKHLLGKMGRKKKKEKKEGPLQQAMNSNAGGRESERGWLNQSGTEMALGEGTDVMEVWIGRFFLMSHLLWN